MSVELSPLPVGNLKTSPDIAKCPLAGTDAPLRTQSLPIHSGSLFYVLFLASSFPSPSTSTALYSSIPPLNISVSILKQIHTLGAAWLSSHWSVPLPLHSQMPWKSSQPHPHTFPISSTRYSNLVSIPPPFHCQGCQGSMRSNESESSECICLWLSWSLGKIL